MSEVSVMQAVRRRQAGFDLLRCAAALAVVFIHCPLPGDGGMYVLSLTRFAVPCFFMLSGFFYPDTIERCGEVRQLKKMGLLLLGGCSLYILYGAVRTLVQGSGMTEFVRGLLAPSRIVYFLVLNDTVAMGDHLWYLAAMVYILVGAMAASRLGLLRLWPAAGLLLAGQLLLGRYSQLLLGLDIHNRWSRNFFFLGLPFFLLGYGLRQKDELLARWFEPAGRKAAVLAASVLMAGLSLAECAFSLNGPAPDSSGDLFVSSIPLAILVFLLARYCFEEEWRQYAPVAFMLEIGRRHSLGIYVLHPMLLNFVVAAVGLHWYTPMLAFAASLAVSALAHTCVKRIPFGKQQ